MSVYLVYPMALHILFTWLLSIFLFHTRTNAVKTGKISVKYFQAYIGDAPERATVVGRHYDNQFQLPLFFYLGCITHISLGYANKYTLGIAWLFILARLLHSFIHLGSNYPLTRAKIFALGWLFVLLLWGQAVYFVAAM